MQNSRYLFSTCSLMSKFHLIWIYCKTKKGIVRCGRENNVSENVSYDVTALIPHYNSKTPCPYVNTPKNRLQLYYTVTSHNYHCKRTNLNARFGQVYLHCNVFAHKYIWISSLGKESLEDLKLGFSKRGPLTTLFPWWMMAWGKVLRLEL